MSSSPPLSSPLDSATSLQESAALNVETFRRTIKELVRRFDTLRDNQHIEESFSSSYVQTLLLLREFHAEDHAPRLVELVEALRIDKSNVSRLSRQMVERGHASLDPCPDDRRAKRLRLTSRGQQLAASIDALSLERFQMVLESLPHHKHEQIVEAFALVNQVLELIPEEI